ncbi:MAG: dephospho-CoA kinase [Deltaproteobacteria bacterium]|nr:dephospho-CoA kinase [Deltaproteobacteria bacterium]
MIVVGITGIIGSGKSTVSRILSELGYPVIDLDRIAQSALDLDEIKEAIKEAFGEGILKGERVDRKVLAEKVFNDENALKRLEAITHPIVVRKMQEKIEDYRKAGRKVVFVDAPLIFETGSEKSFDKIVVVYAKETDVVKRMRKRGFEEKDVSSRLSKQISIDEKLKRADYVIYNTKEEEDLKSEIEGLLKKVMEWEVK